jgi:hypothetical protein
MASADTSNAFDHAAGGELVAPLATVAPSVDVEPASFRRIGVGVLVLVSTVELLWVALLVFAVVRFV